MTQSLNKIICLFICTLFFQPLLFSKSNKNSDQKYQDLEKFAKTLHYLNTMYYDESRVSHDKMIKNALSGIVKQLDPHTNILPAEAFQRLSQDTKGEFGGVGMILTLSLIHI